MAEQKHIVVDISPAGTVNIEAKGFNGVGCAKATEQIEIAIGGVAPKKRKMKPEYYQGAGGKATAKQAF